MIVGEDVRISNLAVIRRPELVTIGRHVAIDEFFVCSTALEIGDYVHISPLVSVIGGIHGLLRMGHFTTISVGARIICVSEEYLGEGLLGPTVPEPYKDDLRVGPVIIGNFAAVATNAVVMPGVTIGEGSVVGACSYVSRNTEPWTIYCGTPARPIKRRRSDKMKECARLLGYDL